MCVRFVLASLLLLVVPAQTQQSMRYGHFDQRASDVRTEPPSSADLQAARTREIQHDVQELSSLSSTIQSDLEQLQKGMLSKDLGQHLKKIEKLSKKLRQEVGQ